MIKLFPHIRQRMIKDPSERPPEHFRAGADSARAGNRASKYLLYAIGEIVLVVIGILIALGVAEWNSQRKTGDTEMRLLGQLDKAIKQDVVLLEKEIEKTEKAIAKLVQLDSLLDLPVPERSEELNALFGTVYGLKAVRLNNALYEDLKATVLLVVKDEALRSKIIKVYEDDHGQVEWLTTGEWSINDVNRPYYLTNFRSIRFSEYADPIDLEAIWNDPYYKNIVNYRLVTLRSNQMTVYNRTLKDMSELLSSVEESLMPQ